MKANDATPIKFRKLLIIGLGIIALLAGAGYLYVFVLGAPQPDAPPTETKDSKIKLSFELQTFNSSAMAAVRQYGLILPPGYNKNLKTCSPVLFLLHGGQGA